MKEEKEALRNISPKGEGNIGVATRKSSRQQGPHAPLLEGEEEWVADIQDELRDFSIGNPVEVTTIVLHD